MTSLSESLTLVVRIGNAENEDPESLNRVARHLLRNLKRSELDLQRVTLCADVQPPEGSMSAEAVALGAVAVAVTTHVLPKLIEFLQNWALARQKQREVEIEVVRDGIKTVVKFNLGAATKAEIAEFVRSLRRVSEAPIIDGGCKEDP